MLNFRESTYASTCCGENDIGSGQVKKNQEL